MRNQLGLLCCFLLLGTLVAAQTDDCMDAPELIVVDDCLRSPGNTKGLTENAKTNACGGNADDDGWFKFTAISERTQISVSTDQLTDMVIGAYQNCSIELGCVNGKGVGGQEILRLNTKIGDVYFIQVYEAGDGGAEFLICVSALDPIICTKPAAIHFDIRSPNCMDAASGSIQIDSIKGGTPPYTYQINDNDFQSNPNFSNLTAGQYLITLQDSLDCQFDTVLTVLDTISFELDIGNDLSVDQGTIIDLDIMSNIPDTQIAAISWQGILLTDCDVPCFTPSFVAANSATIQSTLTTLDGCQIKDELELSVQSKAAIYIPNVFSPNGDGINDFFTIFTNDGVTQLTSISIFNRLGGLVFQSNNTLDNNQSTIWDGRQNNQPVSTGVYTYIVVYETQNGQRSKKVGTVSLLL